ncbi:MAG TPA: DUF202 domain-containing protein [Mycobacteriales bacterium]|nr:DUF202 domain-containing protein [Mycobacteriales bacterium]
MAASRKRRPGHVYDVGSEPDPRFSFANERTFLAWIRTALALIAGGVALEALVEDLPSVPRRVCAIFLIVLGMACAAVAYQRWARNERALRQNEPLPPPAMAPLLSVGAIVVGVVVIVLVATA